MNIDLGTDEDPVTHDSGYSISYKVLPRTESVRCLLCTGHNTSLSHPAIEMYGSQVTILWSVGGGRGSWELLLANSTSRTLNATSRGEQGSIARNSL
jgi:hypothetical protein